MMNKKKGFLLLGTLLILCIFMLPVTRSVEETRECVVLDQRDPSFHSQVTLELRGNYRDYLLRRDVFEGTIVLPEYDLYNGADPSFEIPVGIYESSNLMYLDQEGTITFAPASFYASEDLERCFLWIMVPNENNKAYTSRYFIAYPEMTLEQLYQIIEGS